MSLTFDHILGKSTSLATRTVVSEPPEAREPEDQQTDQPGTTETATQETQDSESCDPSSNLGGTYNFFQVKSEFSFMIRQHFTVLSKAVIAQLGERQTEDLKVPGSIPGRGIFAQIFSKYFTPVLEK